MMSSLRGLSLLRATGSRLSHSPSLHHHHFRPGHIASRISPSPSPPQHTRHGRRSFHWQSAISTTIEGTQSLIVDLHTVTNLPWFLTIPLVAFTVGAVFRLPSLAYNRRILQRRANFDLLLQAWNARIQKDVVREGIPVSSQLSEVKARQDKALKRIYRKLGLQDWRLWSGVLSFPFWLLAIDAVRRLCGGPRGLIGLSIAGFGGPSEAANAETSSLSPGSAVDTSTLDPAAVSSAVEATSAAIVDPSLTFEGCLWFTDLTASDPYHILPFALSASLVLNLLPKSSGQFLDRVRIALGRRPKSARAQTLGRDEKVGSRERTFANFHVGLIGIAALVGPLTLDLPAALHLYWLTSSMSNALFTKGLKHLMPVKTRVLQRCTGVEVSVIKPQRR
ncbi:hypothetical protein GQX73_g2044 [Xylaria multiplex]|uniref:Uncharacterized protein n=1 Tax=Xylaria multiplex TaxID=323545 RepID=A0A7C8IVM9_9PEZI|nr:hypothetical protein GQX73_g2044 [Xylaria multiplex]